MQAKIDNPQFEYAIAITPAAQIEWDEEQEQTPDPREIAWQMARELLLRIVTAAEGDGEVCLMMQARAAGMSYAEISSILGTSRQNIHKRLQRVCAKFPEMAVYVDIHFAPEKELVQLELFEDYQE